jgi:hypothetical protein
VLTIVRDDIRKLYEQYEKDPEPLNLLPELAQCRAILHDFIERYDTSREAFLDWHASFTNDPGHREDRRDDRADPRQRGPG